MVCVSDTVQPGTELDAALWERFREDVERRHGGVRGHLRSELETAIREYLRVSDEATPAQLNRRLQRIEAAVGASPTDGGEDTLDAPEHTHARTETPTEKPASNTATEKKVAWLAECVRENHGEGFHEVTRNDLADVVKDEYGFRADTARRYVERLIEYFDLTEHPGTSKVLVTDERYDEIMENRRDGLHKEAQEKL